MSDQAQHQPNPSEKLYAYYLNMSGEHGGSASNCYNVGAAFPIRPQTVVSPNSSSVLYGGEHFTIVGQTDVQTYIGTATDAQSGKVIGFIFEDSTTGQYFLFSTNPHVWKDADIVLHPSGGLGDSHQTNWDLCTGAPVCHCFMPGTAVMTPFGEMPVESLKIGDLVTLDDGSTAPVNWLGVQTVSKRFADPLRSLPIRISAGALGGGLPQRDLLISPAHAILLDGILVQAGALLNGGTITREADVPEIFCYYHVEVEGHVCILAEGVAAETFVDNVSRMSFDNWEERDAPAEVEEMRYPRVKSARQLPRALRARLGIRVAADHDLAA